MTLGVMLIILGLGLHMMRKRTDKHERCIRSSKTSLACWGCKKGEVSGEQRSERAEQQLRNISGRMCQHGSFPLECKEMIKNSSTLSRHYIVQSLPDRPVKQASVGHWLCHLELEVGSQHKADLPGPTRAYLLFQCSAIATSQFSSQIWTPTLVIFPSTLLSKAVRRKVIKSW